MVECLWDILGDTATDRGYRVRHLRVRLIYGDSITPDRTGRILEALAAEGFASDNTVFGISSYTDQHVTRGNFGTALRVTFGLMTGEAQVRFKAPRSDSGTRTSKRGLRRVKREGRSPSSCTRYRPAKRKREACCRPSSRMARWCA